jgi:HlyD family secretion protein
MELSERLAALAAYVPAGSVVADIGTDHAHLPGLLKRKKLLLGIAAVLVIALAGYQFLWGAAKKAEGNYITGTVKKGTITNSIPATGTIEPVSTVSLNFKNAEIIKKIYVKVGDHVTTGQLLAEQESDNLEAQLIQSRASLKSSIAKFELLQNGATEEEIAQAEINVTLAGEAYNLAKADLERKQELFEAGALSRSDLDEAQNSYVNAEGKLRQAEYSLKSLQDGNRPEDIAAAGAQVESSNAQVRMAEKDLAGTKMTSPIDGIISEVNGGEGQRATANNNSTSGSGAFIVVISEALQVKAQVNEADIGSLAVGQRAEFTVNSYPDKTFTGRVNSISPQAYTVSNVQIYDAIIQLDENQEGLKAGMPANVNIIVARQENTLIIPKGAVNYAAAYLNKTGQGAGVMPPAAGENRNAVSPGGSPASGGAESGGSRPGSGDAAENAPAEAAKESIEGRRAAVLVLDQSGKPAPRQVLLGISNQSNYEVLEGLKEGEAVVVGDGGSMAAGEQNSRSQNSGAPFPGGGVMIRR